MAARKLGAPVSGFRQRAPQSAPNVSPSAGSVSKLGQAGTLGPAAGQSTGSHGVRVQGIERVTKTTRGSSGKG